MKKIKFHIFFLLAMLIVSMILVTGCNPFNTGNVPDETNGGGDVNGEEEVSEEENNGEGTETPPVETDKSQEIRDEFNLIEKTAGNIEGIFDFIDENIMDSNPDLASDMVYAVIRLCEDYKFEFTDKFTDQEVQDTIYELSPSLEEFDLDMLRNTDNEKVKAIIEEAINKKYKILAVEGFIMPLVDYQAYDIYRQYLTQEMNDYLDIKLDESNRPSVLDAGIVIPVEGFIQRILKSIEYLENYPDSPRFDEVKNFNDGRIYVYLSGIDNNPVFDIDQKIIPEKLAEFQEMLTKYSDTRFGEILGAYLDLLEQEDYMRTQNIEDFLNNVSSI